MKTGEIIATINTYSVSEGYLPLNGSVYLKADYPQLNTLLGASYSVNATQFITPDLTGRSLIGGNVATNVGSANISFANLPLTSTGTGQPYTGAETSIMVNDYSGGGQDLSSLNAPTQTAFTPLSFGVNYYIKW